MIVIIKIVKVSDACAPSVKCLHFPIPLQLKRESQRSVNWIASYDVQDTGYDWGHGTSHWCHEKGLRLEKLHPCPSTRKDLDMKLKHKKGGVEEKMGEIVTIGRILSTFYKAILLFLLYTYFGSICYSHAVVHVQWKPPTSEPVKPHVSDFHCTCNTSPEYRIMVDSFSASEAWSDNRSSRECRTTSHSSSREHWYLRTTLF